MPIAALVVVGLALLFAGPVTMGSSVFAEESSKESAPVKEDNASSVVAPVEEESAPVQPEAELEDNFEGNAFYEIEQVADPNAFSPECFAEIDAAVGNTVELVFTARPEIAQAIEVEAEEVAAETEAPAEVSTQIEDVVVELEANNTEVAAAVEETVTAEEVVVETAEGAIVDEIIELEGAEETVAEVISEAVVEVVTGESTAEEAVAEVEQNVTAIAEGLDVTVEDVQAAAENVQSENVVVDELGGNGSESAVATIPSKEDVPLTSGAPDKEQEPIADEHLIGPEAPAEVSPEVVVEVEETIDENVEEIAQESGVDAQTVLELIEQAQANLDAAKALIA
jgi:hypothetical protein